MSLTESEIAAILRDKRNARRRELRGRPHQPAMSREEMLARKREYAKNRQEGTKERVNAAKRARYAADPSRVLAGQKNRREGINARRRERYATDAAYREREVERVRLRRTVDVVG